MKNGYNFYNKKQTKHNSVNFKTKKIYGTVFYFHIYIVVHVQIIKLQSTQNMQQYLKWDKNSACVSSSFTAT